MPAKNDKTFNNHSRAMAFQNSQKSEHSEFATQDASELEAKIGQHGNLEGDPTSTLTPEHREYLIERHGTFSLDPLPSSDPADPYNWPAWKVYTMNDRVCIISVDDAR